MSEVARSKVQNDPRTAAMSEVARSKVQNDPRTAAHVRPPVEVRRSEVSAAGAGLFLRCDAPAARPGDLLALYAGVYTPPVPSVTHAADGYLDFDSTARATRGRRVRGESWKAAGTSAVQNTLFELRKTQPRVFALAGPSQLWPITLPVVPFRM